MNVCEFCGKDFYSKYTLKTHQQTAKACVQLKPLIQECFQCDGCHKTLHSKARFEEHVKNCKDQKDIIIEKLKEELRDKTNIITRLEEHITKEEITTSAFSREKSTLETKIHFLEKQVADKEEYIKIMSALIQKPKIEKGEMDLLNTNVEFVNNSIIPNITADTVKGGYKRVVKSIIDNYLKDDFGTPVYKCVDPSRKKFQYRTDNGVETDIGCTKLLSILEGTHIKDHCIKLIKENRELFNVFFESGEYGYITKIFSDDVRLSSELVKHLV
jgi:hypothetical protein